MMKLRNTLHLGAYNTYNDFVGNMWLVEDSILVLVEMANANQDMYIPRM